MVNTVRIRCVPTLFLVDELLYLPSANIPFRFQMIPVCDVQYSKGRGRFGLSKVGVNGVMKPVRIVRKDDGNELNQTLLCSIDVCVDLPATQKGSHLSRNVEAIRALIDECASNPVESIDGFAVRLGKLLLEKHEYAETAYVSMETTYFKDSVTPNGRSTLEGYSITAEAEASRGDSVRKTLTAEVIGMSACPCAQQTVTEMLGCTDEWPVMTHNQRNICTVSLTTDESYDIPLNNLIDNIEKCFSSPTFELLKRDDEGAMVINAHRNTKFVEDVVRDTLSMLVSEYDYLPDYTEVWVRSESEESIHKHNAFAERSAYLGDLREE